MGALERSIGGNGGGAGSSRHCYPPPLHGAVAARAPAQLPSAPVSRLPFSAGTSGGSNGGGRRRRRRRRLQWRRRREQWRLRR